MLLWETLCQHHQCHQWVKKKRRMKEEENLTTPLMIEAETLMAEMAETLMTEEVVTPMAEEVVEMTWAQPTWSWRPMMMA